MSVDRSCRPFRCGEIFEGQLEFVDALKPDITSYLATETTGNLTTSSELGHLNLASWLTPKRCLASLSHFDLPHCHT